MQFYKKSDCFIKFFSEGKQFIYLHLVSDLYLGGGLITCLFAAAKYLLEFCFIKFASVFISYRLVFHAAVPAREDM